MTNEVEFPTRISMTISTCLDHVYTNLQAGSVNTAPVATHLSDHLAVRTEVTCNKHTVAQAACYIRSFSKANQANFVAAIESIDWDEIKARNSNPSLMARAIIYIISNKIDICFPLIRRNSKNTDPSWITTDIDDYKLLLFELLDICERYPSNDMHNLIKDMQLKYHKLINNKKSGYYSNIICCSNNSSKAMWAVINKERGKGNSPNLDFTDIVRNSDGTPFLTKESVVDAMNQRFLSAAAACGAPRADVQRAQSVLCSARPQADRSLRLTAFSAYEIYQIITSRIPPKPSKDAYGISMKLVKLVAAPLASVLSEFFNACIREGSFPTPLKFSKVSPLYKGKGKKDCMDNYRPVSIIPTIAKILENGLCSRLIKFLSETNALSDRQYAYREGRSTTSLARELVHQVMFAREQKMQVAVICCDLSKAFDVADRAVLALKLQHYGVVESSYALVTDLLRDRTQVVVGSQGKVMSAPLKSEIGVAQGSSVSNILFSLLLNDLPDAVTDAVVLMYADDVAALVTAESVDQLEQKLNYAANQLALWFQINGLALNLRKTHFMRFVLSGRSSRPLAVSADGVALAQVKTITFLGFEIDECLKWDRQIDKMCGKLGSACYALNRISRVLPEREVRSCYFATVHSQLQYGAELWGRAADWLRAFRMQKRAVRAIVGIPQDMSARPHFIRLGILTLPAIIIYQVALYTRLNLDLYPKVGSRHSYCTRSKGQLAAVSCKLIKSSKTTHVMGPTVYNQLPDTISSAPTIGAFKARLKKWLVEQAFYCFDDFVNI